MNSTDLTESFPFGEFNAVFGKEADEDMPCIGVPTALDKVPGERVNGVVTNLENVHPGVNTKWFRNMKDANPRSTDDYVNSTLPKAFNRMVMTMPHHIEAHGNRAQDVYGLMPDIIMKLNQFGLHPRSIFNVHNWKRNDFEYGRAHRANLDSKGAFPVSITIDHASGRKSLSRGADVTNPEALHRQIVMEVGDGVTDPRSNMNADACTLHPKRWFEESMVNRL